MCTENSEINHGAIQKIFAQFFINTFRQFIMTVNKKSHFFPLQALWTSFFILYHFGMPSYWNARNEKFPHRFKKTYRQSGWLCTRWGEIAQTLNFKYLYKSHCKSYELLWVLYSRVFLKSQQQFVVISPRLMVYLQQLNIKRFQPTSSFIFD
jgi:hypothetical protein